MSTYIGQIKIGATGDPIRIGATLFGVCDSDILASNPAKVVTLAAFDQIADGVSIAVKFVNGNTATSNVTLQVGSVSSVVSVSGNCLCDENDIIIFTYDGLGATPCWRSNHTIKGAMPISGGTFTGSVVLNGAPSSDLEAATKKYVDDSVNRITGGADAMIFKGTLGAGGTITAIPNGDANATPSQVYKTGWTYRVSVAGTYNGIVCEVGDLLMAIADSEPNQTTVNTSHWTVAQTNIDGAVTSAANMQDNHTGRVAVFSNNAGTIVNDTGFTIGTSVPSGAVFRDTTYTVVDGTAYKSHSLTGEEGASILASVSQGTLTLAPGIKFTTAAVGTSLTESVAGYNPS